MFKTCPVAVITYQVVASSYAMHINMHRLVGSKQMFDNQMYLKIERLFGRSFLYLAVHIQWYVPIQLFFLVYRYKPI